MKQDNELPLGWVKVSLDNVVDILDNKRKPINAKERSNRVGNIPYYGATGQVGWIDDYLFDEEIILLGEDGAPFLDSSKNIAYIVKGKSWVNNHAHVLKAKENIINAYIQHQLNIISYKDYVTGTTRLKLNQAAMRKIPLLIAPFKEQHRIVTEIEKQFSRLDETVSALKRIQANLKRYKASVLKSAVEGKLTAAWREQHPALESAQQLLERILKERHAHWEAAELAKMQANGKPPKDNQWKLKYKEPVKPDITLLPELPAGWVWANIGLLTWSVKDGPHYSPKYVEKGIPFISGGNIKPSGIDFSKAKYISEELHEELCKRCKPEINDILYTKGGTTGIARVNTYNIDFSIWVHVAILKLIPTVKPFYLQHTLNSNFCRSYALTGIIEYE